MKLSAFMETNSKAILVLLGVEVHMRLFGWCLLLTARVQLARQEYNLVMARLELRKAAGMMRYPE